LAVWWDPAKTASASRTEKATEADAMFWDALHGGRDDELPNVIEIA